jgi:Tocopherol cyclase
MNHHEYFLSVLLVHIKKWVWIFLILQSLLWIERSELLSVQSYRSSGLIQRSSGNHGMVQRSSGNQEGTFFPTTLLSLSNIRKQHYYPHYNALFFIHLHSMFQRYRTNDDRRTRMIHNMISQEDENNSLKRQRQQSQFSDVRKIIPEPKRHSKAYPQQTPHSGCHYSTTPSLSYRHLNNDQTHGTSRTIINRLRSRISSLWRTKKQGRFTEGWYYRLTIPEQNVSFAIIISIEDPGSIVSPLRLVCIQIIGPNDEYILRGSRQTTFFWSWKYQQGLGCTFSSKKNHHDNDDTNQSSSPPIPTVTAALTKDEWYERGMF